MLDRVAVLAATRPRRVLLAAVLFAVVAGVLGGPVVGKLKSGGDFEDSSSASVHAKKAIAHATGAAPDAGIIALLSPGVPVRSAAGRAKVVALAREIARDPGVDRVVFNAPGLVARDGRSTYLPVVLRAGRAGDGAVDRLSARFERQPGVKLGGGEVAGKEVGSQVTQDLGRAEALAFPILFLLSLWVFRSLVAALLPLLVGGLTIVTTFLGLRLVNGGVTSLSIFALNLVTGLGLGLAIDYSLFIVSRYREELARHGPGAPALRATLATAGRTVAFSALTVSAALASLLVFPLRFLYSMGIGGAICALAAAAVSLLVLPAVLALLGTRVNALAPARWRRDAEEAARPASSGAWYRLSRAIMRRPAPVAIGAAVLMLALGTPFLGIRFTGVDATDLPRSSPARQVDDALRRDFPPSNSSPAYVVVHAPSGGGPQIAAFGRTLGALPGVRSVGAPRDLGGGIWRLDVLTRARALAPSTQDLIRRIADTPAPFDFELGGDAAAFLDQQDSLRAHLPVALGILAVTTLTLLFLMTGSVVLPVKTLLMNALSLSAAFGLLVLIFQDGRLQGLLGFTSQGALESTQPVLLFAVAFGLSTDYGVFLLGRIKEARDRGAGEREAVALGLERTGRIVSAAALLFCVAIGAFATSSIIFIKEVGVGTALAVIIDATIVRALLVPSLMALLGRRNWWAPAPLRRVHDRLGLREASSPA